MKKDKSVTLRVLYLDPKEAGRQIYESERDEQIAWELDSARKMIDMTLLALKRRTSLFTSNWYRRFIWEVSRYGR